jgi:glycosyltransferase involved in cell wall biosynthesis
MRICIVTTAGQGIGGMQQHTFDLAGGLTALGHEVEVLTGRRHDGITSDERFGARWHYLSERGDFTSGPWLHASAAAFLRLHGEQPFDVIHGEGSSALGLVQSGIHRQVPLVVEFHGNYRGLVKAALRRSLRSPLSAAKEARYLVHLSTRHYSGGNAKIFRECEAVVPSRQQLKDTCRSHRLDPSRVHIVPNGVDAELFRPRDRSETRRRLGLPEGPLLVCVGRLNREKGMHHAIVALAALGDRPEPVRLAIVGGGEEDKRLRALTEQHRVGSRVHFAGPRPVEDVASYMAAADVFLFPTEREEAAPFVLPQAMSSGTPVVASRIGGISEVIDRPGENGLLVEPGDVAAVASAVRDLLGDAARRAGIGTAGRKRVLDEYTIARMVERTLAVYRLTIERHAESLRLQSP